MFNLNVQKQRGIGFIEVLITTLVVAFGLLAVASLQTKLMSGSGNSKTRAEALALAEQKIEDVRNQITKAGYTSLTATTSTDSVTGTNASFTRAWTITDNTAFLSSAPARKNISVKVSWGDAADEKVNLVTEIAWIAPSKTALYASENSGSGAGATPSPRQNASEDVASENVIGTNMAITDLDEDTDGTAGVDSTLGATGEDDDGNALTITLYQVAPGSHFYTATRDPANDILKKIEQGVIAVFLCQGTTCTHIQNHFGGAVLRIKGTVYSTSENDLDHIQVAWTSSTVNACYNGAPARTPDSGTFEYDSMPYECVFAGNCNATTSGNRTRTASGTHAIDPGCFVTSVVSDTDINSRNVGPGGEYGDVGLLGVKDSTGGGFRREETCFLEDTATATVVQTSGSRKSLNNDYLFPVTKRLYVTRRISSDGSINSQNSEGINRSYSNHNFLIIERKSNNTPSDTCDALATANSLILAPRTISRIYNESASNNNVVVAESTYTASVGNAVVTTGTVASDTTDLRFYIQENGACYVEDDNTDYACVFPAGTTAATINGGSTTHPDPATDPQSYGTCSPLPAATCNWPANF